MILMIVQVEVEDIKQHQRKYTHIHHVIYVHSLNSLILLVFIHFLVIKILISLKVIKYTNTYTLILV